MLLLFIFLIIISYLWISHSKENTDFGSIPKSKENMYYTFENTPLILPKMFETNIGTPGICE